MRILTFFEAGDALRDEIEQWHAETAVVYVRGYRVLMHGGV